MNKALLIATLALPMVVGACATPAPTRAAVAPPPPSAGERLDARLEKADLAFREARLSDAERLYRSIAEAHPSLTEVWVRLGNIYTRQDELDAAIRAYEMALRNDRYEGRAWYNLSVVHLKQSVATLEQAGTALPADSPYRKLIDAQHSALLGRVDAGPAQRLGASAPPPRAAGRATPGPDAVAEAIRISARTADSKAASAYPNCWEDAGACAK